MPLLVADLDSPGGFIVASYFQCCLFSPPLPGLSSLAVRSVGGICFCLGNAQQRAADHAAVPASCPQEAPQRGRKRGRGRLIDCPIQP